MGTLTPKKRGRLDPTTRPEWFKTGVEDSVMALIVSDSPTRNFTADTMVLPGKRDEFDRTVRRLCELGCCQNVLFYCLSWLKSAPAEARLRNLPSAASMEKLARRMEKIAEDIKRIESTGVLDPLDEEEFSGNSDDIVSGANWAWIRTLPRSLERRAGMYRRWAERLSVYASGKTKLLKVRRDLLRRVHRLCVATYVKLVTNPDDSTEPKECYGLIAKLMKCVGETADRSQLKRELQHFESMHFQACGSLEAKLRARHNSTEPKSVGI
jgi:hypothetical protein